MFGRILKQDFLRNKVMTVILSIFIMLAVFLMTSAIGIMSELLGSIDTVFSKSSIPHFIQMHKGEIDSKAIDAFASQHSNLVKRHQVVEMITIHGANITLGNNEDTEATNVMENAFVKQNTSFDYLLDTENEIIQMEDGEIAVPLYHKQQYNLQLGDIVKISNGVFHKEFFITSFVRDAQMNPSIVTSKRFLLSVNDWQYLNTKIGEIEYIIAFQLHDVKQTTTFENLYQSTSLPQLGPTVTYPLFRLLNSIADGVVAIIIICIAVFLVAIAALCLRFTLISTMEEEYRELGVLKAIGICNKEIRTLYLSKYVVVSAIASLCGYIVYLFLGNLFLANIRLYMGGAEKNFWHYIFPILGAIFVFLSVVLYCRWVLRKFQHISVVEAIRKGKSTSHSNIRQFLHLRKSRISNVNVFLGIKEILERCKVYGVLCFVFIICSCLISIPLLTHNTMASSQFITYMGTGKSDIRIDLQQEENSEQKFNDIVNYIETDNDIDIYATFITSTYKVMDSDGAYENIKIEVGDFTVFPLSYFRGQAPKQENEIALSVMYAEAFEKTIGDTLNIIVNNEKRNVTICGIYQDVTNGGKTAKAILPYDSETILWYTMYLNVQKSTNSYHKVEEYRIAFHPTKVMHMDQYMSQTLGTIVNQLAVSVAIAMVVSFVLTILITTMFFKMLITKDRKEITIMRSLGFTVKDIYTQYITRILLVLFMGNILGLMISITFGQRLVSLMIPGISNIRWEGNLYIYFLPPILLLVTVMITISMIRISSKEVSNYGNKKGGV